MATTIGTFVKLKIGSKILTGELSSSLSLSRDTIDIASKETGDWAAFVPGRGSGSFTADSVADWGDVTNYGLKDALDAYNAKTLISFTITEYTDAESPAEVTGAVRVTGTGYITSVDVDNPDNDKAGFSINVEFNAEPTVTLVTE